MLRLEKLVKGEWIFCTEIPSREAWENAKATGERVRLIDSDTKIVVLEYVPKEHKGA